MDAPLISTLLSQSDPEPVHLVNAKSLSPLVLLCEHAGREIPHKLGDLGLAPDFRNSHRGWDIGAENVAIGIANTLNAPLVVQRYSRLVLDANRSPDNCEFIPEMLDGVSIEANQNLDVDHRHARIREIFEPMDEAINAIFSAYDRKLAISIHSFTPQLDGSFRPWHAGFLTRYSKATAIGLMDSLAAAEPELNLALNEPYRINDETDWFIPKHAEPRNLAHCLIEIRNDQIKMEEGARGWANRLSTAIGTLLQRL